MRDSEIDDALSQLERDGQLERLPNDRFRLTAAGRAMVAEMLITDIGAQDLMGVILDRLISQKGGTA